MLPIGVIERFANGSVKTSNNVGLLEIYDDVLRCEILYRSADHEQLDTAMRTMLNVTVDNDIEMKVENIFPAWPKNIDNPLNKLITEAYEKTSDIEIATLDIHWIHLTQTPRRCNGKHRLRHRKRTQPKRNILYEISAALLRFNYIYIRTSILKF